MPGFCDLAELMTCVEERDMMKIARGEKEIISARHLSLATQERAGIMIASRGNGASGRSVDALIANNSSLD